VCSSDLPRPSSKQWIYPITGNIGLNEVVDTFIELINLKAGTTNMSEELEFTTKLLGGIKPEVALSKLVPNQLRLISAELDAQADRTDVHKVTVTLIFRAGPPPDTVTVPINIGAGVDLLIKVPKKKKKPSITLKKPGRRLISSRKLFSVTGQQAAAIKRIGIRDSKAEESDKLNRKIVDELND